jgi:hypothetical protein
MAPTALFPFSVRVVPALRRKPDVLLIYFSLFAVFYGARLWLKSDLLRMALQIRDYQRVGT